MCRSRLMCACVCIYTHSHWILYSGQLEMKRKTSLPAFQFHSTLIHNLTHARKDLILYIWDQQTMFLELHPSACQLRMGFFLMLNQQKKIKIMFHLVWKLYEIQMSISKFCWDTARFVYILFMAFPLKYNGGA